MMKGCEVRTTFGPEFRSAGLPGRYGPRLRCPGSQGLTLLKTADNQQSQVVRAGGFAGKLSHGVENTL